MIEYKNGSVKLELEELNQMAIYAGEAAMRFRDLQCPGMAQEAKEWQDRFHNICEAHGLYETCVRIGEEREA